MKTLKDMISSTVISIALSATIFLIAGVIFDQIGKGSFVTSNYQFTKMALACVATGLGFGVPSALYRMENVPKALAAIIHLGIGLAVYFFAALKVGWIPVEAGTTACVCTVIGVIVITALIWLGFMKYNKNLAERMNQAIRNKNNA